MGSYLNVLLYAADLPIVQKIREITQLSLQNLTKLYGPNILLSESKVMPFCGRNIVQYAQRWL